MFIINPNDKREAVFTLWEALPIFICILFIIHQLFQLMGITGSSNLHLQPLPSSNWEQLQPSTVMNRPVHYGKYKLYCNTITFQQVESYSLHFQSNEECEEYLLLYRKRLKDEYLVNSRFIDLESINICGCGRLATVYIEHIPIRLVEIKEIEEQDYLYVLLASLKGFQKLYNMRGYFMPNEEMIGFDCEGRLKVWFNPNFSKALANTIWSDAITDLTSMHKTDFEEQMVWEIIEMVWSKAPKHHDSNRYEQIFALKPEEPHRLNFALAKRKIRQYADEHNIEIKKYFDSILPLIRHKNLSSQQFIADGSSVDFDGIQFRPIKRKNKIIYYLNPYESSQGDSSQSEISEVQPYHQHLQENALFHKTSIVSVDRMPTNAQTNQNYQFEFKKNNKAYSDQEQLYSSRILPRIKFNYNYSIPQACIAQPHYYSTQESINGGSKAEYTVSVPLDVISEKERTEKQRSSILSNRMKYNTIFQQLDLDQELRGDLMKMNKQ